MTICGYNRKIGMGLNLLFEGMASAMQEKADLSGTTVALDTEIFELEEMIKILEGHGVIQEMFVGLNIIAKHMFNRVKQDINESNNELSIIDAMENLYPAFVNTIKEAEEYRNKFENPNDVPISDVANWVNDNINYPSKLPNMDEVDTISYK